MGEYVTAELASKKTWDVSPVEAERTIYMPYRGKTGITDNVEIEAPKGTGGIEAVSLREHSRAEREPSPTIPVLSANAITRRAQANPRPNAWLAYDIGVVGGWNLR